MKTLVIAARTLYSLLLVATLSACSVQLVSEYDEQLDKGITELQKQTASILAKMNKSLNNPSISYQARDYDELRSTLDILLVRSQSRDKNEATTNALYAMGFATLEDPPTPPQGNVPKDSFSLQKRHMLKDAMTAEDLRDLRTLLNTRYQAILRLELAKKRGSSLTKAS